MQHLTMLEVMLKCPLVMCHHHQAQGCLDQFPALMVSKENRML